jgi:ABC-type branched-subunit amino acid transport system permease subunit
MFGQPPLNGIDRRFLAGAAVGVLLLLLMPLWSSNYALLALRDALVLAIFALSYDFLWGKAHTLSMGHGLFFGFGAYALAITNTAHGWPPFAGLLLGIAVAAAAALLLGWFLIYAGVRLHFFAIITMACLLIAGQLATSWSALTAGDVGILGIEGFTESDLGSYFFSVALLLVVLAGLWLACRGNYGKVLAAIGTNELRATSLGYDTSWQLLVAFMVSAAVAALSGAVFAAANGVVAPDMFSFLLSTEVILWVAVGGRGTLLGPVIATVLLTRMRQEISSYSTEFWPLIVGTAMLALVLFLPNGLRDLVKVKR